MANNQSPAKDLVKKEKALNKLKNPSEIVDGSSTNRMTDVKRADTLRPFLAQADKLDGPELDWLHAERARGGVTQAESPKLRQGIPKQESLSLMTTWRAINSHLIS